MADSKSANDPVRALLQERGAAKHVIEGGLEGLVDNWERIVEAVGEGYNPGLDDYLNDMDVRQLIEAALEIATQAQVRDIGRRLNTADETMQSLIEPAGRCLWGEEVAEEEGWNKRDNWWYFTRPIDAGDELLEELDEE
ncbi:MAG: hypothetical protein ACKV2V_19900 [Blastocatellia bacterium]